MSICKFVILAMPRTGSTMLNSTLRSHPQVFAQGELFHRNTAHHYHPGFAAQVDLAQRHKDPASLIARALDYAPEGQRVRGFKHFYLQSEEASHLILADTTIRKIVLERENRLASFSSLRIAVQDRVWKRDLRHTAPAQRPRIAFVRKAFEDYRQKADLIYGLYRAMARGPVLDISYESLCDNGFGDVLRFLGLPAADLPPATLQINAGDILSRFQPEDIPRVQRHLARIGHPDWGL